MNEEKQKRNQSGQIPSDIPSEKLKHPPEKKEQEEKVSKSDFNTTAKDPTLGRRNTTGR